MKHKILLFISKRAGLYSSLIMSTTKISDILKISQQSVSRHLIEMEEEGFIKRELKKEGITISLGKKGREYLKEEFNELNKIMKSRDKIKGKIFQGLGEGSHYTNIYEKEIKKILGYLPYPGTLNLRVKELEINSFISDLSKIKIKGFSKKDRTYGDIYLYKIILEGIESAILIPERTLHGKDVVEIIGPECFRSVLNAKEGDLVELSKMIK